MLNLYKNTTGGYFNPPDTETRIINSDALMEEKFKALSLERIETPEEDYQEEISDEEAEFLEGVEALVRDEDPQETADAIIEEAKFKAQELSDQANQDAQAVIAEAQAEAERILNEAREQGYQQGLEQAEQESREKINAFEERVKSWEDEVRIREAGMERDLVDKILTVVDKVFRTTLTDKKSMILMMVTDAINGIEGSKNFTIRVAPDNLAFMESVMDSLARKVGSSVTLEAASDSTLDDSQCVIETETGVYDCSPLKEFENLAESIRILSAQ